MDDLTHAAVHHLVCWLDWCPWRRPITPRLAPSRIGRLRLRHLYEAHSRTELLHEINWCDYQFSYLRHVPEQGRGWQAKREVLVGMLQSWPGSQPASICDSLDEAS